MGASLSTITQQPALRWLSAQRQFQLTPLTKVFLETISAMLSRQSCVKLYRYIINTYGIKGPYTKRREGNTSKLVFLEQLHVTQRSCD